MPTIDEYLDEPVQVAKPDALDAFLDEPVKPDARDAYLDEPIPVTEPEAKPVTKSSLLRRALGDPAISLGKGIIGVPAAVTGLLDIPTGGGAGKFLKDTTGYSPKESTDFLDEFLTPEQKLANAEVEKAKGFVGTAKAMVQNPSTIGHTLLESAPSMLAGGAAAKVAGKIPLIAKYGPKALPFLVGGGEGAISAGQTATSFREQSKSGLLTPEQAALALSSGAFTAMIGVVGGKVAQKLGITDIDLLAAGAKTKAAKDALAKRVAEGFVTEGAEELSQSAVEQIHNNIANGKPWMEGVPEAMAQGVVTGGVMGGAVNLRGGGGASVESPAQVPGQVLPVDVAAFNAANAAPVAPAAAPAPVVEAANPKTGMEFAREVATMTGKDFREKASSFNKQNIELGLNVTDEELAELKQQRDKATADLDQRVKAMSEPGKKPTDVELQEYTDLNQKPQFFNEAIRMAELVRAEKLKYDGKAGSRMQFTIQEDGPAKGTQFSVPGEASAEEIAAKKQATIKSFEPSPEVQGAGTPPVEANMPPVVGAQPEAPGAFPKRGPSIKKEDLKPGERIIAKVVAQSVEFKGRIAEWLKGKPEGKAIVWEESARDKNPGNVKALTKNIGDKKWWVTTFWKRGDVYMPSGHREYSTRLEAMHEEGGDVAKLHDSMPGRVMDEQEVYGYKLLKDIPDQNNLVWYKTNPKYAGTLFQRMRGTGWLEMLVKDSITSDGRVAFLDVLDPNDAERLRLKPEKIKDPAVEMDRILQLAKSAPEEDQGVDASLLTKEQVRALGHRGLQFKLDKRGRRWATYNAENRKADLAAQRKAEAKAAQGPKVHPAREKAEDRPRDILDEILDGIGSILRPTQIEGGGGDSYGEGYKIVSRSNPRGSGNTRLFSENGDTPDNIVKALIRGGKSENYTTDNLWNDIDAAMRARAAWAKGIQPEQQAAKFHKALTRQEKRTKSTEPLRLTDERKITKGTTFTIEGEEFEITYFDLERNEVELKDGSKFGLQHVPEDAVIRIDKGSLKQPEKVPSAEFDPFAFDENAPIEPEPEPEPEPEEEPPKPADMTGKDLVDATGKDTLSLVGESAVDAEKAAAEKAQLEADRKAAEERQQGFQGMGGAVPGEFKGGEGDYVSNMFAAIDRDRAQMGKPPMPDGNPRTWDEDNQRALAKMNREPDWIPRLIQSVLANPRTLLSWENAGVVWYRARLRAEANNALGRVNRAYEDDNPEGLLEAKLDAQRFEDELAQLDEAVGRGGTGSEAGRSLQAQKMAAGDDFTLIEMRLDRRARQNDGAPLTEKQEAEVKALYDELQATRQAFEQFKKDAEAKESGRLAKEGLEQIEREKNKPKASNYVIAVAEKWVNEWDKGAEAAEARIAKRLGRTGSGPDPSQLPGLIADLAIVGRSYIGHIGLDVAKFGEKMVAKFGDWVKPHINEIFIAAKKLVDRQGMPPEAKKAIKEGKAGKLKVKDMTPAERKERLKEKLRDKFDQDKKNEITGIVQKIALEVVEDGARGWEAILDGVHAIIQGIDPEFTRRETMDAISGYGKYKRLSMDEIDVALREGKGEMQQMAKIEDITSGVPPKPTGIQRRKASDSEREKIKLVNELKKKHPELFEGSGLKSSLESRKTYYRNRTADLQSEINAREKLIKDNALPPTDAELEAIKAEYETVKAEWEAMFKKGLTDAQKIALVKASIERQIADLSRRIAAKDFAKKKPSWFSKAPELDPIKAERDALRAEFNALRDLDPEWQSEQAIKKLEQDKASLERTIAEQERKLRENDLATKKQPVNRPADPALEPLKQQRDRLAKQIAERRKKSQADKWAAAQAKRLEQMNKAIAEKEAKLAAGDLSTAPRPVSRPFAPDLEVARQRLDELNRQLADARKPKRSQADKDLQQFLARKTRQIVEWERRIREGDFEKKGRREISMTPEATELQGQAEAAKNKYLKARWDWAQSKRTTGRKIWDGIQKTRGAFVNIASSFDFSAPRQGLLAILSNITRLVTNPIQGTRMLVRPAVDMFKAWASDVKARGIEQRRLNRHNALNGVDKIAGIEYSALDSNKFTKYEENAHSILDEWAELPLRTGNAAKTAATFIPKLGARGVRMSNRAFITFLNQTRAGLLDELLRVNFKDRPPTEAELKLIGNMVNIATGRGKLKPLTAQVTSEFLWAPKLLASRVQFLTGQPFWTGKWAESSRGRKIVAKEYARIIMGGFLLATVARMFSDKKEDDPTSSDFGKIVRGKIRIDPWGGFQQVTTLGTRIATAKTKTLKGDVRSIGADKTYGQRQPWYVFVDFLRSKARPDVGTAIDIGNRVFFDGDPVTPGQVAKNLLVPLPMREITTVMKESGFTEGMIIEALGQFGAGVSVYKNKESQR